MQTTSTPSTVSNRSRFVIQMESVGIDKRDIDWYEQIALPSDFKGEGVAQRAAGIMRTFYSRSRKLRDVQRIAFRPVPVALAA